MGKGTKALFLVEDSKTHFSANRGQTIMTENEKEIPKCAQCPLRDKSEKNPNSLVSKIWRWHTTWCPGWKQYQEYLAQQET